MSQTACPVYGNGFVIYDEYDEENPTANVKDFLVEFKEYVKNSGKHNYLSNRKCEEFDITDVTYKDGATGNDVPFVGLASRFDYSGPYDDEVESRFISVNGDYAYPMDALIIWSDGIPSMYEAPYKSKEEFVGAVKAKLKKIGFMDILGEDFDYEAHIGEFSTCTIS